MRKYLGQQAAMIRPFLRAVPLFLLILFSANLCHADCTEGLPMDITSITPSTWYAGQTYTVVVTGDFPGDTDPNAGCVYSVGVSKSKAVIPSNYVDVNISDSVSYTPTQITLTVQVPDDIPTETAYMSFFNMDTPSLAGGPPIQIVDVCPVPNITSISPGTWFAGNTYDNVVIKGAGFTTTANATADCPVTALSITAADGSVVPVSGVTVVDKTKITATIAPPAGDPTETATVTVGTAPNTTTTMGQVLGNQIQCDPSMGCTQTVISTTDGSAPPVQNVVVGQPIILTTLALPSGISATKTIWTVGGTNIGGYAPTTASAAVTKTELKTPSLNTYWVYPETAIPVTYQYCVTIPGAGNQCSEVANASFDVSGPTANIVPTTTAWQVSPPIPVCNSTAEEQMLSFGTYNPTTSTVCNPVSSMSGITFTATVNTLPGSSGQTEWIQVISADKAKLATSSGQTTSFSGGSGLDSTLPYNDTPDPVDATTTVQGDSPGTELPINDAKVTRTLRAKMYLMWTSQISGSIPVPLGYVQWAISATAVQNDKTLTWSVASSVPTTAQFYISSDTGTKTYGLPTWSRLVTGTLTNATAVSANENEVDDNEEGQQ